MVLRPQQRFVKISIEQVSDIKINVFFMFKIDELSSNGNVRLFFSLNYFLFLAFIFFLKKHAKISL